MSKNKTEQDGMLQAQGQDAPPSAKPNSKWRDLIGGRNKELNLDDDDAVGDYLAGEFSRLDKSDEVSKRLNELISKDKRNAGLYAGAFSGQGEDGNEFDLVGYIVDNWWDEIHESTNSEEAIERINRRMAQEEEDAAKDAKRDEDAKAKFEEMATALNAAMQKTNADQSTAQKVVDWLYGTSDTPGLYSRIPERSVNEDDFIKLIYAFTRDKSLEDARNEGIREGKERRAGASHRSASQMAQTDLGTDSGGVSERSTEDNPTVSRYSGMKPRYT